MRRRALDLLGNWATFRHDRNGEGDFNDSSEVEDRTHNAANEVASAAIQGLGGSPFAQRHDHAGNWTRSVRSGAQRRDYVHDAWNRLVKATDDTQPATVRGEYEYNGLHWLTVKRLPGSSVTAERRLFYSASWQVLEERIDDDVDEGFEADRVAQQVWGVRYIDDAVLRRTDANADGDYVDEGDRVDYYITDAQFSVVAVVKASGALQERVAYSPYGEGRHHWPADLDGDGDVDSGDMAWYQNSANLVGIGHANYNPDADLNRDGVVGTQDIILALNWNGKAALPAGLISDPSGPDNPVGYCGYVFNAETGLYTVRFRHYDPVWGRWVESDPAGYVDGMSLYQYALSEPIRLSDRNGWQATDQTDDDDPRDDPSQGCGIKVYQNDIGNGYGHRWIVIDDPRGRKRGLGWWPAGFPFGGRGAWYSYNSNVSDSTDTCVCYQADDQAFARGDQGDTEWDVTVQPRRVIRVPGLTLGGGPAWLWEGDYKTIPFGSGKGTDVRHATCDHIRDCLDKYVSAEKYDYTSNNCRHGVDDALDACGLMKINQRRTSQGEATDLIRARSPIHRGRPIGSVPTY